MTGTNTARDNSIWARTILANLIAAGLQRIVISPGSRSTPIALAALDFKELKAHVVLDERSAGFFALGLARGSGRPVALLCTSGSAVAHYLPAVIEADASLVPLIILSADRPAEAQRCGDWQTIDQQWVLGRFLRDFEDLGPPSEHNPALRAARSVARAMDSARHSHRGPGPVQLNIPFRTPLWDSSCEDPALRDAPPVLAIQHRPKLELSPESLRPVLDAARKAKRGLIILGGPASKETREAALSLARQRAWPVLAEALGSARSESKDVQIIASADTLTRSPALQAALQADFILKIGATPVSKPLTDWLSRCPGLWLLDAAGRWNDPHHRASQVLVAPPESCLCAISEGLKGEPPGLAQQDYQAAWALAERAAQAVFNDSEREHWEGALARRLTKKLAANSALHLANSMPVRDIESFAGLASHPLEVFVSRGANGIDGTIATAHGEAEGSGRPLTLLIGDLAFAHDASSLALRAECSQPLRIVLVQNGGGGIFGFLPIAEHPRSFEKLFLTPQQASPLAIASAYGWPAKALSSLDELDSEIATPAQNHELFELTFDRGTNLAMHREVQQRAQRAAEAALAAPGKARLEDPGRKEEGP